jgi:hypothetical protein
MNENQSLIPISDEMSRLTLPKKEPLMYLVPVAVSSMIEGISGWRVRVAEVDVVRPASRRAYVGC